MLRRGGSVSHRGGHPADAATTRAPAPVGWMRGRPKLLVALIGMAGLTVSLCAMILVEARHLSEITIVGDDGFTAGDDASSAILLWSTVYAVAMTALAVRAKRVWRQGTEGAKPIRMRDAFFAPVAAAVGLGAAIWVAMDFETVDTAINVGAFVLGLSSLWKGFTAANEDEPQTTTDARSVEDDGSARSHSMSSEPDQRDHTGRPIATAESVGSDLAMRWGFSRFASNSDGIAIKNAFSSSFTIPWKALLDVGFSEHEWDGSGNWPLAYRLKFQVITTGVQTTFPSKESGRAEGRMPEEHNIRWIVARATHVRTSHPSISGRHWRTRDVNLQRLREDLLATRDFALGDPATDEEPAPVAATGVAAFLWAHRRTERSVNSVMSVALVVGAVLLGLPMLIVAILDDIAGGWLGDHVFFWNAWASLADWIFTAGG